MRSFKGRTSWFQRSHLRRTAGYPETTDGGFVLWKRKSLRASGTGNHRTVRKGELPAVSTEKCGEITFFCLKNEKILVRYGKNVIK